MLKLHSLLNEAVVRLQTDGNKYQIRFTGYVQTNFQNNILNFHLLNSIYTNEIEKEVVSTLIVIQETSFNWNYGSRLIIDK